MIAVVDGEHRSPGVVPPHPAAAPRVRAAHQPARRRPLIFVVLAAGFLPTFGFITAIMVGCTAGSRDLTEGMFRHLVVTGRSRLALYLARIPAGLAILVPLLAIGYTIVCAVSVFAAPTFIDDSNVNIPPGLSAPASRTGPRATPSRSSASPATAGTVPGNAMCAGPPRLVEVSNHPRPARARRARSSGRQDRQPATTPATPRFSAARRSPS